MSDWRKSSHSGEGDGNNSVEMATTPTHISVRDSKTPNTRPLTFPVAAFAPFLEALKAPPAADPGRRPRSCRTLAVPSDHVQSDGRPAGDRGASARRARRRAGAHHVRQRGERLHGRPRGHRPRRR
ncbi:DUF397 domain-containing protein [Streptomyces sp. HM190]|uniref:DUF397 domain-containing protein n=1 Tax=Streptomyces sp. HM190 TaxID=2695266 RepID=UPI003FA708DD